MNLLVRAIVKTRARERGGGGREGEREGESKVYGFYRSIHLLLRKSNHGANSYPQEAHPFVELNKLAALPIYLHIIYLYIYRNSSARGARPSPHSSHYPSSNTTPAVADTHHTAKGKSPRRRAGPPPRLPNQSRHPPPPHSQSKHPKAQSRPSS
jgi:hypothetical protein